MEKNYDEFVSNRNSLFYSYPKKSVGSFQVKFCQGMDNYFHKQDQFWSYYNLKDNIEPNQGWKIYYDLPKNRNRIYFITR